MSIIPCITVKKYIQINITIIIHTLYSKDSFIIINGRDTRNANYKHNRVYMQA